MDLDAIRFRFIQDNLRLAMVERDSERRLRVLKAFRAYFEWFGDRFPDREKLLIAAQLARLEESRVSAPPNVR
jgi:hypothetical protein